MLSDATPVDAAQRLGACQDMGAIQAVIREMARQLIGADGVTLVLRDEGTCHYVEEAAIGPLWKGKRFPIGDCLSGLSMLEGEPLVIDDVALDERVPHALYAPTFVKSMALVPIRTRSATGAVGALGAYWATLHHASGEQLDTMKTLADSIAIALANVRLIEQLVNGNRQRDEFLALLAHELRSPLAPIRNAVHLLGSDHLDTAHIAWVRDVMERQVQHLSRMVDDLLDVSRITTGKASLRHDRIDLNRLVGEVLGDRTLMFEAAGILRRFEPEALPLEVMGDDARLTQVLGSVLDNAAKYTPRGGEISVHLARDAEADAVLVIRDTGVGIEPALLANLFGTFSQTDRLLERREGGLGLGLAVAKALVEDHGGRILARSGGRGTGTEIEIRLPLAAAEVWTAPPELPAERPRETAQVAGMRALIIEDNVDAAETMKMLLEKSGVQVRTAHDAAAGMREAEAFAPDFVLCDIGLPGVDGYAVARALREGPATSNARLIALTGYGGYNDRHQAMRAGFDVHLVKPIDPQELLTYIVKPGRRKVDGPAFPKL